ncbi:MAG: SRPBCC family protein [Thermomicrobiales bacterium]|nr:SRPBCC family protein [Thermomicrobiales bacterium]
MIESIPAGEQQISRRAIVNAPVAEIFALVASPHRHHELDGSGTVGANISGPERVQLGDTFSTHMKMFGIPYKTTSKITQFAENQIIEWQVGNVAKWRWEFREIDSSTTEVTETWDIRAAAGAKVIEKMMGKRNANGIEETLRRLQERYA